MFCLLAKQVTCILIYVSIQRSFFSILAFIKDLYLRLVNYVRCLFMFRDCINIHFKASYT